MNRKVRLEDLLPVITETLAGGKEFTLPVTGTSMLPLLVQGRDTVTVKSAVLPLKRGDIPLYRRESGAFVLHRVVDIRGTAYVMCGDNQFDLEYPIYDSQIIGVVSKIQRNGKTVTVDSPSYKAYSSLWTGLVGVRYPVRRLHRRFGAAAKKADAVAVQAREPESGNSGGSTAVCISPEAQYLITLCRAVINNESIPEPGKDIDSGKLLLLAQAHRVTGLCAHGIARLADFDAEVAGKFKKELYKTVMRSATQNAELKKIGEQFTQRGIAYCVLKGDLLSSLYPSADMRFSLDCDIYVSPAQLDEACAVLTESGYIRDAVDGTKDIAFTKKPFMTVELHFSLSYETDVTNDAFKELSERLVPCEDNPCRLQMTKEDFYVYTLGHTAHHFLTAGTGIRSVADDYLLRKNLLPECDSKKVSELLQATGLTSFAQGFAELGDYWFGTGEGGELADKLASYVIESGIYGTDKQYYINSVVSQSSLGGSETKYILRRLFPPRADMAAQYPVLRCAPVLMPVYWGVRWLKVFGNLGRYTAEASAATTVDALDKSERESLFGKLGF